MILLASDWAAPDVPFDRGPPLFLGALIAYRTQDISLERVDDFLLEKCESDMFASRWAAVRLFGLDAGDWSVLLVGLALTGFLVVLV